MFAERVFVALIARCQGNADVIDALAFGLEHRRESTSKRPSALLSSASTIGATNFEPTSGSRNVTEFYLETIVPTWKSADGLSSVDVEAAIRFSEYSDFGELRPMTVTLPL